MMLLSETVTQRWNAKNKSRYIQLGYIFTKMGDEFKVNVDDLPNGSNIVVKIECDYCKNIIIKPWYRYLKERDGLINKDCCNNCKSKKIAETAKEKYGVNSVFSNAEIKAKIEMTNIEKYGCINVFSSEDIKNKIYSTNIKKYGYKSPMQSSKVQNKASKTCLDRHGVSCILSLYKLKGESNPNWKGGISKTKESRLSPECVKWRYDVYKKDNFTCQRCGTKSSKGRKIILNAHHIYNWNDYIEKRYDINNGITLCKKCHLKFHSLYGKKYNNKSQIDEFINNYG